MHTGFFKILLLMLFLSAAAVMHAQDTKEVMAVELKSGQVVYGTILFQSADVVVIQSVSGDKMQYQQTDLDNIRQATENEWQQEEVKTDKANNLGVMLQIKGGACHVAQYNTVGMMDAELIIGHRHIMGKNIFAGVGFGYRSLFIPQNQVGFIPLFAHLEMNIGDKRFVPAIGMEVGYAFGTTSLLKGGAMAEISFGGQYTISNRTAFYIGVFGMLQQTRTNLIQTIDGTDFSMYGNTTILGGGVKLGLLF